MSSEAITVVSILVMAPILIGARWAVRARQDDWVTSREVMFVGTVVAAALAGAAISVADSVSRNLLLGFAAVAFGLLQRRMTSSTGIPVAKIGSLVVVVGVGAIILGVAQAIGIS